MDSFGLSSHIIETVDSTTFSVDLSCAIASQFKTAGFVVQDVGHHIIVGCLFDSPDVEPMECACIYLDDDILWIKAIAARWWFRDTNDDRYFNEFWKVVDQLKGTEFKSFIANRRFHEGTVGDLPKPEYCDEGFKEAFESGALKDWFGTPADYEQMSLF
jgi:hypothetical protein